MPNYYTFLCTALLCTANFFFICQPSNAQQIEANVDVNKSQINSASIDFLDNFGDQIESYLNDYSWTNEQFEPKEKINVNIQINFLSASGNNTFGAAIIIRSLRPIYNTLRQTPVFLFNDKNWTFTYTPNRGFVHDKLQFDELTTLLDFYAYIIIGYDYDTFSELGGNPYFTEAQNLVSRAQQSSSRGWDRSQSNARSRAQLIDDILNPNYQNLRQATYIYHRKGLDLFLKNPRQARINILKALRLLQKAKQKTTNNLLINIFLNAKAQEIVSIFTDAPTDERLQAYNILSDIDPSRISEYSKLQ